MCAQHVRSGTGTTQNLSQPTHRDRTAQTVTSVMQSEVVSSNRRRMCGVTGGPTGGMQCASTFPLEDIVCDGLSLCV